MLFQNVNTQLNTGTICKILSAYTSPRHPSLAPSKIEYLIYLLFLVSRSHIAPAPGEDGDAR